MLFKEDKINPDGMVDIYVNCYIKMSRLDYLIYQALLFMNDDEKERLLLEGIPQITDGRVAPAREDCKNLKNHAYRLKNFKMFAR